MTPKSKPTPSRKADDRDEPGLGWPGYRTREGRTGWDPVDADNEAAHMTGTVLQRLFYGRIRNPAWLFLVGLLGAILVSPLGMTLIELLKGNELPGGNWLFVLVTGIVGAAILVNFLRNLARILSRRA